MAYGRKRRRYKRSSYNARQLKFRTGGINAAGAKPLTPQTRVTKSVTAQALLCTGITCGDGASFNITEWSAPADPNSGTFTIAGTANNKPSNQDEAISDGYDISQVLSSMYRFDIRFKGDNNVNQDFVFAYAFSQTTTAILTHTAGTVGIDNWKDLRMSPGWVWHRMSATSSGGSIYPSAKRIEVTIPNVWLMVKKLTPTLTQQKEDTYGDITTGADIPTMPSFLHIECFTIDGVALTAGDIAIDVTVYQKVKLMKIWASADVLDEAIQEA